MPGLSCKTNHNHQKTFPGTGLLGKKTSMRAISLLIIAALWLTQAAALEPARGNGQVFETRYHQVQGSGMWVLTGWAAANITWGLAGNFTASGEALHMHRMNAMWNTVNLGLGVAGLIGLRNFEPGTRPPSEMAADHTRLQNIFMINAGLNTAYIMTGVYLRERSRNQPQHAARLSGYGTSLIIQGSFLLLFDTAMAWLHGRNARMNLYPMLNGNQAGLMLRF
jgi:hypothetical protein